MSHKSLICAVVICLLSSPGLAAKSKTARDERLLGTWGLQSTVIYEFKANGTGRAEGEYFLWKADGKTLVLSDEEGEQEMIPYSIEDGRLTVEMGGSPMTLDRKGSPGAKEKPAAKSSASKEAADDTGKLLLSTPWCSFSYNKITGASKSKRVVFMRDGTWSAGGRAEGYSSGSGGTMASQSDDDDSGRWKVDGGRLLMSSFEEPSLSPVDFRVTRNSNGSPIINADGVEYAQCR